MWSPATLGFMDRPPRRAAQRAASALREAIRTGQLLPGEHIRQEIWAERLSVSRLPIREALHALTAEGTVDHDPNRGYFVGKRGNEEMAQLYRLRELIEPEVIRTITWPDDDTIANLERLRDRAVEALGARDVRAAMEHDRSFCWTIWELSPLKLIVAEAKRLWQQCDPHRARAFNDPLFVEALADAYQARFDAYLQFLAACDREGLVDYVMGERRAMVRFLSNRTTAPNPFVESEPAL
jgi:DNA-binding GntR family transcriptional regulator